MEGHIMWIVVLVMTSIVTGTGFLLDDHCPAPPPCTCNPISITCNASHLNSIPEFKDTGYTIDMHWILTLSFNNMSSIPNNSFISLVSTSNGHMINIDMRNNNLMVSGIEIEAFNGIAEYVYYLNLDNNKLTSLPAAIGKLIRLSTLRVMNNPIVTIDERVIKPIGHTLRYFYVSLVYVQHWPESFHYLKKVQHLELYDFGHVIPDDGFTRLNGRPWELEFHNSTFGVIPAAVCNVTDLWYLQIEGDANFTGDVNGTCVSPFRFVQTLSFINDGMHVRTFPAIFDMFPRVSRLKIQHSDISYIDESVIPVNNSIVNIDISDSKFTSFPRALRLFPLLREIALDNNLITNLGSHSVENFLHLGGLFLRDNPILSISTDAFWNLPSLRSIYLDGTKLNTVPQAVASLPGISMLEMDRNPIECNCNLKWVEQWASNQHVHITGTCKSSIETIKHYITEMLQLYHCV